MPFGDDTTLEREVLFELREHPGELWALTLSVAAASAGHAVMALSVGLLSQALSGLDTASPAAAWAASAGTATYFGLGGALVKAGASAFAAGREHALAASVTNRIRRDLVAGLLSGRSATTPPRVLSALAVRIRVVEHAVREGVLASGRAVVQLVPLAAALVWLSPRLAALGVVVVLPFAVGLSKLRRRVRTRNEDAQRVLEQLERGVDELVRHADLFRTHGAADRAIDAVTRAAEDAKATGAKVERTRAALSGGNEVLAALAVVGVVAILGRMGLPGSVSAVLPFAAVFFMAYRPLRDLGDAKGITSSGSVALAAVRDALRASGSAPDVEEPAEQPTPAASAPATELSLRTFGATERGPRTSLDVAKGELVAVVGPTGSGKTTLFRALLGLEAAAGHASARGVDVTHAPPGPVHRPFAWVPQDAPIVTGTVRENVRLFGGTEEDATRALASVGATHLGETADDVGPAGRPLSGGERRLVSLARALATGLPVLLLDEPTEGLDAGSTRAVLGAITALRGRRTVLVATHREEVLAVCDRVVSLGAPSIAERLAAE